MKRAPELDEQQKSLELLAMERLLRNESKSEMERDGDKGGFGASIVKKELKKVANDK